MATIDDIMQPQEDVVSITGLRDRAKQVGTMAPNLALGGAMGAGAPAQAVTAAMGQTGVAAPNTAPGGGAAPEQEKKPLSYVEMMQQLNPYKAPTSEEVEKARKKEKRDRTFAAIGDGIAALANLYFAGKGAANSFNPQQGMYAATSARWDKYNKERKEDAARYANAYMQAMRYDQEAARDDRNWRRQLERDKRQDEVTDRNYNFQKSQADWQHDFQTSQADWQHDFQTSQADWAQKNADRSYNLQVQAQKQAQERWEKEFEAGAHHGTAATNSLGKGGVVVSMGNGKNRQISLQDLSQIFRNLPEEVQAQVTKETMLDNRKKPIKDRTTGEVMTKDRVPTADEMLYLIGRHLDSDENVRNAWMQLVGEMPAKQAPRSQYDFSSGSDSNNSKDI